MTAEHETSTQLVVAVVKAITPFMALLTDAIRVKKDDAHLRQIEQLEDLLAELNSVHRLLQSARNWSLSRSNAVDERLRDLGYLKRHYRKQTTLRQVAEAARAACKTPDDAEALEEARQKIAEAYTEVEAARTTVLRDLQSALKQARR